MPRQSNGIYQVPAGSSAVPGTTIGSSSFNALLTDLSTELTNSLDRLGRSAMTAALNMGGFGVTNLAAPVNPNDAVNKAYAVSKAGDTMTGNLNMGGLIVYGMAAPVNSGDAVNKAYADGGDANAYNGAVGHADAGDANTLSAANQHSDAAAANVQSYANGRFAIGVRFTGAQVLDAGQPRPTGAVVTRVLNSGTTVEFRTLQFNINGAWTTVPDG